MLSVVVPIYNEEENITAFHAAVLSVMESLEEHWEVIYVNDGSRGLAAVDLDQMNRLTAATAAAFERCILRKKFGYPQS